MSGVTAAGQVGTARATAVGALARRAVAVLVAAALLAACRSGSRIDVEGRAPVSAGPASSAASAARADVPELAVPRVRPGEGPRIDGRLDDPAWRAAADTGPFRDVATGGPSLRVALAGSALLLWDDEALYVGATIADRDVEGGFPAGSIDPHLWTRDTFELMLDPDGDGDGRDYYEIQVGPQNLVFDSRFDAYNAPRGGPDGPFGHEGWASRVESAVAVYGTLDEPGDQDEGYVVEARLPWAAFDRARRAPPLAGDRWRVNLYALENNGGIAWSPILGQGNFHRASRFGRVLFVGARGGGAAPRAPTSGSAAGDGLAAPPGSAPPAQGR